jgi:hypothetical protein
MASLRSVRVVPPSAIALARPDDELGCVCRPNLRGGFKPWLRLATVLDLHPGCCAAADRANRTLAVLKDKVAATQQEAARIDSEPPQDGRALPEELPPNP